jgi:hypothetical protein
MAAKKRETPKILLNHPIYVAAPMRDEDSSGWRVISYSELKLETENRPALKYVGRVDINGEPGRLWQRKLDALDHARMAEYRTYVYSFAQRDVDRLEGSRDTSRFGRCGLACGFFK